jgi:UDP-3-O-acyl-N-acetylglucosamine deacetylase
LHYPNEAARHKLLDVAGDLAPYRNWIKGKAYNKPGHFVKHTVYKDVEDYQNWTEKIKFDPWF